MTYGHCLINKAVSNAACYLKQLGSVGVRDLIPWKTLLKTSLEPPSCLPHVMLSDPFNKYRVEPFVRDTHDHTQIQQNTDTQGQTLSRALRRAQIHSYNQQTGVMEDTGSGKKRIQIWVRWRSNGSEGELFGFFPVTPVCYWRLSLLTCSVMDAVVKIETV